MLVKGLSTFGLQRNRRALEIDIKWAKDNLEDPDITEELERIQQKVRVRIEQKMLISGAKRQVLGQAEPQVCFRGGTT